MSSSSRFVSILTILPTSCQICLKVIYEPAPSIIQMRCGHWFHIECLQKRNKTICITCPYDRQSISPPILTSPKVVETSMPSMPSIDELLAYPDLVYGQKNYS